MRVQAISNNIVNINSKKYTTTTSPAETIQTDKSARDVVAAQNIAFHGLFDNSNPD